jgi:hypothetical protein
MCDADAVQVWQLCVCCSQQCEQGTQEMQPLGHVGAAVTALLC